MALSYKTFLFSGVSILAANAVVAQSVETEDQTANDIIYLDEITIYGDRGANTLEESLSSVSVINGERLDDATTQTVTDTFRQTVNVTDGDLTESGFVIRGINSEGMTPGGAGAPLASIYIDGVQQTAEAARRGARSVFDAEQVEIYRGPQSTLTGRNALAGAVYIKTKDPEFFTSGEAEFTYGENNKTQVGLAYGGAITDNLAYRVRGVWSKRDTDLNYPSYESYDQFDDFSQDEYYTIGGKLLWLPTHSEDTQVLFSYSHSYDSPDSDTIAGPNWGAAESITFDDRRGDIYGSLTPAFYGGIVLPIFQDVRHTTTDNAGIEITHRFNDNLTLTALTGYSDSVTDRRSINYGISVSDPFDSEGWTTNGNFDQSIFSQEVRLNYESDGLRWVGGVYYADETNKANRDQLALGQLSSTTNRSDINNAALFGEITYEFAPRWSVIAGGRVDYYAQDQYATSTSGGTTTSTVSSHSETALIPKLGVKFDINADHTVGLVYQQGYRPGGSGVRLDNGNTYTYDTEQANNFELTWRGQFMDGRLNVNTSVFYQDWDNQQVEIWEDPTDPLTSIITNAGASTSYGGEFELSYQASDNLSVYAGVGLLHTEFKDFEYNGADLSGQPFSNAPEQTFVLGIVYGQGYGWYATGNVKYVGSALSRIESGGARGELGGYTTVDAEVGYTFDNGFRFAAYATNLFDEQYFTYNASPAGTLASLGDRREVGIRLNKTF